MPRRIRTTSAYVSWKQVATATGYTVSWGTTSKVYSYTSNVGSAFTSYKVPSLKMGTPYYFAAKSFNTTQTSPWSNEIRYVP